MLAGLHVKSSSSKVQEDDLTARHLDLRGRIHSVGHVSAQSRAWLLANATAVLYPTSAEGFGFVPYEAAALGAPTVFTDFGPLAEISGVRGLPAGWSIEQYAADLVALLSDEEARADRVAALQVAIARHTWAGFAEQLVDFFVRVTRMPEVATSAVGADTAAADAAALSSILSSRTWRATEPLRRMRPQVQARLVALVARPTQRPVTKADHADRASWERRPRRTRTSTLRLSAHPHGRGAPRSGTA